MLTKKFVRNAMSQLDYGMTVAAEFYEESNFELIEFFEPRDKVWWQRMLFKPDFIVKLGARYFALGTKINQLNASNVIDLFAGLHEIKPSAVGTNP